MGRVAHLNSADLVPEGLLRGQVGMLPASPPHEGPVGWSAVPVVQGCPWQWGHRAQGTRETGAGHLQEPQEATSLPRPGKRDADHVVPSKGAWSPRE